MRNRTRRCQRYSADASRIGLPGRSPKSRLVKRGPDRTRPFDGGRVGYPPPHIRTSRLYLLQAGFGGGQTRTRTEKGVPCPHKSFRL